MPDGNLNIFSSCFDEPELAGRVQHIRGQAALLETTHLFLPECGVAKLLINLVSEK